MTPKDKAQFFRNAARLIEKKKGIYADISIAYASDPTYTGYDCELRPLVKEFYDTFGGSQNDEVYLLAGDDAIVACCFMAAITEAEEVL